MNLFSLKAICYILIELFEILLLLLTIGNTLGNSINVRYNVIERITIATPGNSADFGDLTQEVEQGAGMSGNAA